MFLGIQINSTNQLIKKLDANAFNPDETLLVKVPITVPYASDSKDFERVNGTFEYEGQIYRLVKQKLYKDTLHVVILQDKVGSHLNKTKNDFAKSLSDQPLKENKSHGSKIFKQLLKDYLINKVTMEMANAGFFQLNTLTNYLNSYSFSISRLLIIPPENSVFLRA